MMQGTHRGAWGALVGGLLVVAACSAKATAPPPEPPLHAPPTDPVTAPDDAAASSSDASLTPWQVAVQTQASELQARFADAVVRIVVLDSRGEIVAQHGPIEEPHPTASTIKSFSVAAALAEGVGPDDPLDLTEGEGVKLGSGTVRDWKSHGTVSVTSALARSSNVAIVRLAEKTGERPIYDRVSALVPLAPRDGLDEVVATGYLFGANLKLSTVDLARGYATLAAGGVDPRSGERRLPEDAADQVMEMLRYAVESDEGTGSRAATVGWRVAGKTGTAGGETENTALFFGIAERDGVRHIVGIVVAGVPTDQTGGSVSAAACAELLERRSTRRLHE